jgi:hypothetical protein
MKPTTLVLLCVFGAFAGACTREPEPQSPPPPQPYYPQQPPPQQPPPQAQPAPAPAPTPAPTPATTGTTPAAAGSGTPTSIPGVMKMPDGTCTVMMPGNPQPLKGPCPPGV